MSIFELLQIKLKTLKTQCTTQYKWCQSPNKDVVVSYEAEEKVKRGGICEKNVFFVNLWWSGELNGSEYNATEVNATSTDKLARHLDNKNFFALHKWCQQRRVNKSFNFTLKTFGFTTVNFFYSNFLENDTTTNKERGTPLPTSTLVSLHLYSQGWGMLASPPHQSG